MTPTPLAADPASLVGQWVTMPIDDGPAHVGILTRADRVRPDGTNEIWSWTLRATTGTVRGGGGLGVRPLTRHDRNAIRRARRHLRARRAELVDLVAAPGNYPTLVKALAQTTADLESLEAHLAALP